MRGTDLDFKAANSYLTGGDDADELAKDLAAGSASGRKGGCQRLGEIFEAIQRRTREGLERSR